MVVYSRQISRHEEKRLTSVYCHKLSHHKNSYFNLDPINNTECFVLGCNIPELVHNHLKLWLETISTQLSRLVVRPTFHNQARPLLSLNSKAIMRRTTARLIPTLPLPGTISIFPPREPFISHTTSCCKAQHRLIIEAAFTSLYCPL